MEKRIIAFNPPESSNDIAVRQSPENTGDTKSASHLFPIVSQTQTTSVSVSPFPTRSHRLLRLISSATVTYITTIFLVKFYQHILNDSYIILIDMTFLREMLYNRK